MRYLFILFVCFNIGCQLLAQETAPKNAVSFRHDNDFLLGTDRYYSFGSFIDYRREIDSDFIFEKKKDNVLQLNFSLRQQGFTPDELDETEVEVFDFPFSGWLSVSSEVVKASKKNALSLRFELGVTGDASLAGQLQIAYHEFLDIGDIPTWEAAIPDALLFNLQGGHNFEIPLSKKKPEAFINFLTNASLGTKDVFIEEELLFSFGKRNRLSKTTLYNFINNDREVYGYFGIAYRYVAHNTLIEGSLFNDDAEFTLRANENIFKFRMGASCRIGRNIIKLEYNFNTEEASLSRNHNYTSFVFERNF